MAITGLDQKFAVNPFGKQIDVDKMPEVVQEVEHTIDKAVEKAVKNYELYKKKKSHPDNIKRGPGIKFLAPPQIQEVLLALLKEYDHKPSVNNIIDLYLSRLIQKSYNAGNNDFILVPSDSQLIIRELKGTKQNPLHATIIGNVGIGFGFYSKYCIFDVEGDAGTNCGWKSKNCIYNIQGNTERLLGRSSKDCIFNITENVDYCCDNCSKNSIFKTLNKKTYEMMVHSVASTNLVQLLNSEGSVIMETKK